MQLADKPIFDAYRNIAEVYGSHLYIQKIPVTSIIATSTNSYRVYDSELKIQNISPVFPSNITGICSYSNSMYVRLGTKLLKMSYFHIVKEWDIGVETLDSKIFIFGEMIILAEQKRLVLIDGENVDKIDVGFTIKGILHPMTYVNKIVIYGDSNLELWNVVTKYRVYEFSNLIEGRIYGIAPSPKVDVIAISIEKSIIMFNLKTAQKLFQLDQKEHSQHLTFSQQGIPLLATGDSLGNIRIWCLNTKKIIGVIKAHQGSIDHLQFLPSQLILVSGSKKCNSIKQWKYDESQAQQFRKLRERNGLKNDIEQIKLQSNTQLVINSSDETMYLSLISDNNNYILPRCMDSILPTHIVKNGARLDVYKNQTKIRTIDTEFETINNAKISQSQNYFVVSSNNKITRLGGGDRIQWTLPETVTNIVINQPYYIFATVQGGYIYSLPFAGPGYSDQSGNNCTQAIENITELAISLDRQYVVYGGSQLVVMNSTTLDRIRQIDLEENITCTSFSNDNRFLIITTQDYQLIVWDIFHNICYKRYKITDTILSHQMTPDGSFLLSIFKEQRKVNVWNNFLGVIPASENQQQILQFTTNLVVLPHDLRQYLNNITIKHTYNDNAFEQIQAQLDEIPDANQTICLTQQPLSQWIPLIHYDQIKQRNRPVSVAQKKVQAPFFLDSQSKTNFINKMDQQHRQQIQTQSRILNQKQYRLMEQNSKKIKFTHSQNQQQKYNEYNELMKVLKTLSLAEIDYQLNNLVFDPNNITKMSEFFQHILSNKEDYDLKIVYYYRFLALLGTSVIQNQNIRTKIREWKPISKLYEYTSQVTERLILKSQ